MVRRKDKEREKEKKSQDCGELLSEHILANYSGGFSSGLSNFMRLKVHCPVEGCSFECNTFGEMNVHMKNKHPESC